MFFLSQVILNKFKLCDQTNLSSYSIATGIALYGVLYLYFLYYNEELLSVFNNFMIYVISVDLLLSTFYFYQINTKGISHNLNENCETSDEMDSELDSELTEENESEYESENEMESENESENETQNEILDSECLDNEYNQNHNEINTKDNIVEVTNDNTEDNGTDVILSEAENLIKTNLEEKENDSILLMEERVQIKPRRRKKTTAVLQV